MDQQDYTATILVEDKPQATFEAIKDFRAWWSEDIEGETDKLNEVFFYHYKDVHLCKIQLIESIPNKKLKYKVLDNHFSFTKGLYDLITTGQGHPNPKEEGGYNEEIVEK